jgi:pimeloyl-ACP methyl ester carboxylesterase
MRTKRSLIQLLNILLIIPVIIVSCTKETPPPENKTYVSKEVVLPLTKEYLSGLVDYVSGIYPEAADIKPLIVSDVTVYKIVYKTTVNSQEINASGLVCVPATQGEYPVLSFQNGTNTVNADAPSESPADYSYQMIELLASLGYIVVIADYPGFGASYSIPHPYLVKEPTVRSLVDMLYAVKELASSELEGTTLTNDYYLLGYSQGGWATLALHKALELDYSDDFNLAGSACGAGPYDIYALLQGMIGEENYPMPVYLGYIVSAYESYSQITNSVGEIFNEPYATRVSSLYNGLLNSSQINDSLTTSITDLITSDFLAGFASSQKYASVREALNNNSITGWHSYKPLLLLHGANDTHVNPSSTENIYSAMTGAGTSEDICKKVIIPDADHGGGVIPAMMQGILFLDEIKTAR